MSSDIADLLKIVVPVLIVAAVIIYFVARRRSNRYIVYADYTEYRTGVGKTFFIKDLKRIDYKDKYVIGRGTETANYGIVFYFSGGKAEIDINSNIYQAVFDHAASLDVPKSHTIAKGLLKVNN